MVNTSNINDDSRPSSFDHKIESTIEESWNWISFLTKKWLIILVFSVIGGVIGFLYEKDKPLQFESFLSFSLDENTSATGNFSRLAAQFGFATADNSLFSGDNIVEVIKSRTIIERTLLSVDTLDEAKLSIIEYYNKIKPHKGFKPNLFSLGIDKKNFERSQIEVLYDCYQDIVKHDLIVSRPDKQLNQYVIKFQSPDEHFTKVFTDKVLSETINFYTELKTKKSQSVLDILEQRVALIKNNLANSISKKASVQDANINPAFAAAQIPLQKQQLDMQTYGAAYEELYKNLELARFQYLQDIPLLQIINSNDYPMKKTEPGWLKASIIFAAITSILSIFALTIFYMLAATRQKIK